MLHRVKFDGAFQKKSKSYDLFGFSARRNSGFFGVINRNGSTNRIIRFEPR